MLNINVARSNCASVIAQYYSQQFGLLVDRLEDSGFYLAYWRSCDDITLESMCDDIFSPQSEILIYELQYIPSVSNNFHSIKS